MKNSRKLQNGYYLAAEWSNDPEFPNELAIRFKSEKGNTIQDICYISEGYHFDENGKKVIEPERVDVSVMKSGGTEINDVFGVHLARPNEKVLEYKNENPILFWSNSAGELHHHGKKSITEEELPYRLKIAYNRLYSGSDKICMYLGEFRNEYGIVLEGTYDEDYAKNLDMTYEDLCDAARKTATCLYDHFNGILDCRVIFAKDSTCWSDGSKDSNIYIFIPWDTSPEDFNEIYSYFCKMAYKVKEIKEILDLWDELGDIPMNPDTERIEENWHIFQTGTHREDIWRWFVEAYHINLPILMYLHQVSFLEASDDKDVKYEPKFDFYEKDPIAMHFPS